MSDRRESPPDVSERRRTYLTLMGVFAGLFAAVSTRARSSGTTPEIGALDLATLGLATYRTGRIIAFDAVTEPLRAPFTTPSDGGTEPAGTGVRHAVGELLACPTCIGTWIAAAAVYGLRLAPTPTRLALTIMAAGGIAELLDYATEALDKGGRAAATRGEQIQQQMES